MAPREYKLRPSGASTWVRCHGQPRMLAQLPIVFEDEDTEVREEGTACHWVAHEASQGRFHPVSTMTPNGVSVDEEMLDAVDMYLSTVRAWPADARPLFEHPVHCKRIHEECGGVTDVCGYSPSTRTLYVGDLKYGYRFVDVVNNWQLLCYFAGVLDLYGLNDLHTEVVFVIVQPRSYHRDGPIRQWRVSASDLRGLINQLRFAADAALGVNSRPQLTVNDGCSRCAARYTCTAAQNAALGALDEAHDATPHDLPFPAAEQELRRLQWAQSIVEARITGLESQITHGMRHGAVSKYFALEAKIGREVWKEGMAEQAALAAQLMGVSITKPAQLITPTQAKAKMPPDIVSMYSHRPRGAFKLVPFDGEKMRRIFGKKPT